MSLGGHEELGEFINFVGKLMVDDSQSQSEVTMSAEKTKQKTREGRAGHCHVIGTIVVTKKNTNPTPPHKQKANKSNTK